MRFEEVLYLPRKVSLGLGALGMATILAVVLPGSLSGDVIPAVGCGVLVAATFAAVVRMRTRVVVTNDVLSLRLVFMRHKKISLSDVESVRVVSIPSLAGGGWGYRHIGKRKRVLHVGSQQAIEVHLKDGWTYQIGTERPQDLLAALQG